MRSSGLAAPLEGIRELVSEATPSAHVEPGAWQASYDSVRSVPVSLLSVTTDIHSLRYLGPFSSIPTVPQGPAA